MKKERYKIVLAAMLHDIGKFWQRADDPLKDSKNLDSETYKKAFDTIVPAKDGRPGYQHALWTHRFILSQGDFFKSILDLTDDRELESFALLSAKHHRPESNNIEQAIISMADKWASKNERKFYEFASSNENSNSSTWGKFVYKKMPLHNIFDLLNRQGELQNEEKHGFELKSFHVLDDHTIFADTIKTNRSIEESYSKHWKDFNEEFSSLKNKSLGIDQAIVAIDALLMKYTWCIPSSTIDMPYSSLYQHNKIVAGIASSLYDYYKDSPSDFKGENYDGTYGWQLKLIETAKDPLIMCCIDLSGIQKFIYDIASKSAAKALKGRSYSLQLLMRSCINEIIRHSEIQLTINNTVYASGGKAYLILPNSSKCLKALSEIRSNLEKHFLDNFGLSLYPSLGWISFRYSLNYQEAASYNITLFSSDIKSEQGTHSITLGDLWRATSDKAASFKSKKYVDLLKSPEGFDRFFNPNHINNAINEKSVKCAVTGVRINEHSTYIDDNDELVVSELVKEQVDIGKRLKNVSSISESFDFKGQTERLISPAGLKTTFSFDPQSFRLAPNMLHYSYNDYVQDAHAMLFYGGNTQPSNADDVPKSFHELCQVGEHQTHHGVLKMDVDGLGKIFIQGLPDSDKSFSAYATLSFYLEAFFSGHINFIRNQDEFKDHVQIIYSGGDDVFAVGRWDKIIDFATSVNDAFHRFTHRVDITLSAGIAIVRPKFPIAKSADLAGEAEHTSKMYERVISNAGEQTTLAKNAITFFGQTVSWDGEMEEIIKLKDDLYDHAIKQAISSGFLQKLQNYKLHKDESKRRGSTDLSYKWHSAYTVARMIDLLKENTGKNRDTIDLLKRIQSRLMHDKTYGSDRFLDIVAIASRWTEYLLKLKRYEK